MVHAVDIALKRNYEGHRRFGFGSLGCMRQVVSADLNVFS